jgi:predicted small metal-binding protein
MGYTADMVTTHCKGCGIEISAATEDDLVAEVQKHISEAHPQGHAPSREQVLAVIRKRGPHES